MNNRLLFGGSSEDDGTLKLFVGNVIEDNGMIRESSGYDPLNNYGTLNPTEIKIDENTYEISRLFHTIVYDSYGDCYQNQLLLYFSDEMPPNDKLILTVTSSNGTTTTYIMGKMGGYYYCGLLSYGGLYFPFTANEACKITIKGE